jgi:hypothetical protein
LPTTNLRVFWQTSTCTGAAALLAMLMLLSLLPGDDRVDVILSDVMEVVDVMQRISASAKEVYGKE